MEFFLIDIHSRILINPVVKVKNMCMQHKKKKTII